MKKILPLMLAVMMLTGCSRINAQVPGQPRVVTAVTAEYDSGTIRLYRYYSDGEKIRAVLTYIRCLDVYGMTPPEEPIPSGEWGKIVLTFSDGATKEYEQRGNQYLRLDGGPWKYINADQAQEFPLLLGMMESDL